MVNTVAADGKLVVTEDEMVDENIASTSRSVILLKEVAKAIAVEPTLLETKKPLLAKKTTVK
jgi:hypothetical protein